MKRIYPLLLTTAAAWVMLAMPVSADEQWTADYAKAMKQAKAEKKAVLLDFTGSDWCEWCIKMKKETLDSPAFKNYASKNLVLVEVDFPRTKPQPQEVKAQNQELSSRFKIDGFPSFVILNADGKELGRQVGYLEGGPMAFLAELKKFYKPAPRGTAETGSGDFDIFAKKPAATPAP